MAIRNNTFNLKKYSQNELKEPWYNLKTAEKTKDPQILMNILRKRNNDIVSQWAASNPNCPPEMLAEVLKRGKSDYVSQYAAKNPNCPPKAKIEWMRNVGKIGVEDPSKHIVEYDSKQKPDEDLEKLKSLVSNNTFNLKKHSQEESFYNPEIAKTTKNPDLLRKIIEIGYFASVYKALRNPYCPPDLLHRAISGGLGKDAGLCISAVKNPNLPPEFLVEILKKNKDDEISEWAAENPNCPPEMLAEILRRRKDDWVSRSAVSNPNCPPKEKIEWLRSVGQIGVEDPSKHIVEYDSKQEKDEDLEKLRGLINL